MPKPHLESLEKHTRASRTSVSVLSSTQGATFDTCASQLCHAICQMAWAKTGVKPDTERHKEQPPPRYMQASRFHNPHGQILEMYLLGCV